jgi:DNA sulfur modification protein DndB
MTNQLRYTFPAIRGIQAQRHYYTAMCPLRLIPRIFMYDEEDIGLPAELRAQRVLSHNRIPDITNYIINNRESYAFSAITASIDGDVAFEASDEKENLDIGLLHIPMDAKFIINDGQHRRAAIEAALKNDPGLGDESIAVVFFMDRGLERCQQMFADLNRHSVRPSKSLGVLYDHRDDMAIVTRALILSSKTFKDLIEMERNSLALRSRKLFTLSSIYSATKALLEGIVSLNQENGDKEILKGSKIAIEFWETLALYIPEWKAVRELKTNSSEVRQGFIHTHGITLQAIGRLGNALLKEYPKGWQEQLAKIDSIDWSRSNHDWEGRAMNGGIFTKAHHNIYLTTAYLKKKMKLKLTSEELKAEKILKENMLKKKE